MNKTKEIIKSDGSLKQKIKELIKQVIDEITTSSAAGSGEGSAGVPRVPTWVSKKKNGRADLATKSLPGYTIAEKKGEKKSEKKDKPVVPLVPVGKEKTPDIDKGPQSKGVDTNDLYLLRRRREISLSKNDKKDTQHYDNLIATGEKQLGFKPGASKKI